jgi:hypothetical protein
MVQVIDDFISSEDHQFIHNLLLKNTDFPWYYNDSVTYADEAEVDDSQLTHMFYKDYTVNSSFFGSLQALVQKLNPSALVRVKANLNMYNGNNKTHQFHVDVPHFTGKTAVYYVNTNNGATLFESGEEVLSVQNRIVIFDANIKHAKKNATDTKSRCVINFNFYPTERG